MKKRLYPITYLCTCGTQQVNYVWSNEIDNVSFLCSNKKCRKRVGASQVVNSKVDVPAIRTPTKNR